MVGGQTQALEYDAENRLVKVCLDTSNNAVCDAGETVIASFTYDGDGNRVQSTLNGTTTTFVGGHFEVTGTQVTKYYFAGAQRVAMRKYTIPQPMTVEYMLGDHLGSTSITTDTNGAKVSEIRYKPWGEVRYSWTPGQTTTPAYKLINYTFTGQYSYMDDPTTAGTTEGFGLMFYNARWLDPALGRFTGPDTITPDNPQGFDRYNYVNNRPTVNIDPTGHMPVGDKDMMKKSKPCPKGVTDKRNLTDWMLRALKDSANDPRIQYQGAINSVPHLTGSWPQLLPAYTEFKPIVQNNAYYDVKWNIRAAVGPNQPVQLGSNWYEFSTPGNILYGFYGHAAGYSLGVLSFGAGYAQLNDYLAKEPGPDGIPAQRGPTAPPFYFDTADDHYAVEFGYDLYDQYVNNGLTLDELKEALDNYSHRKDMATKTAPSDCKPANGPYETDQFYNK